MKTVVIIQARLGSTRLPAKVLCDLAGRTVLERCVERVRRAGSVDEVWVATTDQPADRAIVDLAVQHGWPVHRGSEQDLLDRYYQTARRAGAELVVRVTSDCPLIDPAVLDDVVALYHREQPDYASNTHPRLTFPRGLDVEVFSFALLETAWREDQNPAWREHVTPFFYRNPDRFRIAGLESAVDHSSHRWTVDTAEDYELVRRIYEHFGDRPFGWLDVLALVEQHPDWSALNRHIQQKVAF